MSDTEILSQILNLGDEWHIQSTEVDRPSNRLDITIGFGPAKKKSFFGSNKVDSFPLVTLRHLPIFRMRTFLHVPEQGSVESDKIWNPAGSKLTNEMEEFLIEILNSSSSNHATSKISGITAAEVREVSERTGAGADNLADALSSVASATTANNTLTDYNEEKSFELIQHSDIVPPETHENWQRIINGDIPIQTNAVGLQMLLQRIRQDIANNPSEISRIKSAKLLRQYFVKNQKVHKAEIAAISGISEQTIPQDTATVHVMGQGGFPADNHIIWKNIINGDLQIQTSNVALQMMMERVRQSVERNPSEASMQAGTKILRQFFIKHKDRLTNEAQQMGISTANPVGISAAHVSVPPENAACWQQLINGSLKVQTSAVGLQMMMERVRQSVEKNNSQANQTAGIKILRQYFIKHQTSARSEVLQLNGMSGTMAAAASSNNAPAAVPAESHPSWQRLIDGDLVLDTDIVALKMMLQSVRISIEKNPTEASRHAGTKILRQYFIKHKNKHKTELNQLIAA
jgi:phage anti-repressor protein